MTKMFSNNHESNIIIKTFRYCFICICRVNKYYNYDISCKLGKLYIKQRAHLTHYYKITKLLKQNYL